MPLLDQQTLGPARLGFADENDVDAFVDRLEQFEKGVLSPEAWKAFRLVNGVYSQRQDGAMMVRCKIPQGVLTAGQLRALGDVANRYSTGRGHITTRQNVQFHFVKLADSAAALDLLASAGLTTREACGNSVRNVTTCPFAGASATEPFDTTPYAELVTRHLLRGPLSSSLPRKFKIAFGGCCGDADCVGASFNDIGLLARTQGGRKGFRVTIGGGLSTLRRAGILAHEFAPAEEVLEIADAVVRVFDRTGDRKRRHKARLKFVIDKLGPEAFLAEYRKERAALGHVALPPLPEKPQRQPTRPRPRAVRPGLEAWTAANVRAQGDEGYVAVTVRVPLGDLASAQWRELAAIAEEFSEEREARTTIEQNLVLRFVPARHLASLHAALDANGLSKPLSVSDVVSCPGAFSCRLAVTQSRGMARELGAALEQTDVKGLQIRISGCPNGCGQHYVSGIGLQGSVRKSDGKAVPQYHLYLGGSFEGDFGRLAAKLPARKVPEAVQRLIAAKPAGQSARDFFKSIPQERVSDLLKDLEEPKLGPEDFIDLDEQKQFEVQLSEGECAS